MHTIDVPTKVRKCYNLSVFAVGLTLLSLILTGCGDSGQGQAYPLTAGTELEPYLRGDTYGYRNRTTEVSVIPPRFSVAHPFEDSLARVKFGGRFGIINTRGEWVQAPEYDRLDTLSGTVRIAVRDGKYGLVNRTGQPVTPFIYQKMLPPTEGRVGVKVGTEWGFLNPNGELLLEPAFDEVRPFRQGYARVRWGATWGAIDTAGTVCLPPRYAYVYLASEGLFRVQYGRRYGYVRPGGAWAIVPAYSQASDFRNGRANVTYNGSRFTIDTVGNCVGGTCPPGYHSPGTYLSEANDEMLARWRRRAAQMDAWKRRNTPARRHKPQPETQGQEM